MTVLRGPDPNRVSVILALVHDRVLLLVQESSGGDVATKLCPGDFASAAGNISAYSPTIDGSATAADERRQVGVDHVHDDAEGTGGGGAPGPGPVCAACQRVVVDRYYLAALGVAWHVGCLTCRHCQRPLDSQLTCFVRDSAVYCRDDYYR